MNTETKEKSIVNSCFTCKGEEIDKNKRTRLFGKSKTHDFVGILRETAKIDLDIYSDKCGPTSFLCRNCVNKLKRLDEANKSVSELNKYFRNLFNGRELTQNNEPKRRLHDTSFEVTEITRKSLKFDEQDDPLLDSDSASGIEQKDVTLIVTQPFIPTATVQPGQASQALTSNIDLCPIFMSTPKKAQVNKKTDESRVTISVKYPSKVKNKNIVGDFAKIVKAILHQNPTGIANVVVKSKQLREKVVDRLLRLIKTEIDDLCSVKNPSILRGTTKEKLLEFSLEKVCDEWAERAPMFHSFLRACCSKSRGTAKDLEWSPAMAVAGSVLLKQRNKHMNALASIIGLTIKTKSLEVSHLEKTYLILYTIILFACFFTIHLFV